MSDEKESRRFRISRKVKPAPAPPQQQMPETYAEQALREVGGDEPDKGTPEMNRGVSQGCMGCLRVTLLFFLIMLASIVTTWCIRRPGV